jgi:hypothetical protein
MKFIFVMLALCASTVVAQDESPSVWKIMPDISVVKLLPTGRTTEYYPQPLVYPGSSFISYPSYPSNRFSGTGLAFRARFFNADIEPFVLTLSAGANWYHARDDENYLIRPLSVFSGFPPGDTIRPAPVPFIGMGSDVGFRRGFMSFPFGVGVQFVYPYNAADKLMFFVGAEGNLHFTTEQYDFRRENVHAGFTFLGGFAVKFAEFGVRYSSFGGIHNLGVQAGIRLKQFEL